MNITVNTPHSSSLQFWKPHNYLSTSRISSKSWARIFSFIFLKGFQLPLQTPESTPIMCGCVTCSTLYVISPFYRAEEAEQCFSFTQKILNRYDDSKHSLPPLLTSPPINIEVLLLFSSRRSFK